MEDDAGFHDENAELVFDVMMVVAQTGQVWLVRGRSWRGKIRDSFASRARVVVAALLRMVVAVVPRAFVDDQTVPHVLEEEGQKDACHGDCSGCCFVCEGTQTGVAEHEMGVRKELSQY